ncbi:unnamed protein product [Phytomonas sp. EM1]|nr:unnamed protein product [Phytomonas sp. EM1]|eukprot:CCW65158.1 unnamed protein product [Phytomonas sp. isolate EM1]
MCGGVFVKRPRGCLSARDRLPQRRLARLQSRGQLLPLGAQLSNRLPQRFQLLRVLGGLSLVPGLLRLQLRLQGYDFGEIGLENVRLSRF